MLANREGRPGAYELLAVHPNAPADLIAASYWLLVGLLQKRRQRGEYVDDALHELTRAYQCISDPERRSAYDASIGHTLEALAMRSLPKVRRSIRSRILHGDVLTGPLDHYEVLAISPAAPQEILPSAYQIMLNQYLRVPPGSKKRLELLKALEDAYTTLRAPEKREKYDELTRPKIIVELGPPAPVGVEPPPAVPAEPVPQPEIPEETPIVGVEDPAAPEQAPARGLGHALAAAVRLPSRGAGSVLRAARAERRVKEPPPPDPPISREPAPRQRFQTIDVEEALLGRLAAYAREIQASHLTVEPGENGDGHSYPQS